VTRLDRARVVVTRPRAQAEELAAKLQAEGAVVIGCPTIRIAPLESFADLDRALERIVDYRWVVLTSANAAEAVLERLRVAASGRRLAGTRVACVGPATRRAVEKHGVDVAHTPGDVTAERLAQTLEPVAGERILFPRGDLGGRTLTRILGERGALVDDVVVYRTLPIPPPRQCAAELRRGVDALTFTSPSTVEGFVALGAEWREVVRGAIVASIGPTTSAALREAGFDRWTEAREHTADGLVDALAEAYGARNVETRRGTGT